jgi:hypothetical protein
MIELLLPCGFDTLEYPSVKVIIDICMLADYSVAKKYQHKLGPSEDGIVGAPPKYRPVYTPSAGNS